MTGAAGSSTRFVDSVRTFLESTTSLDFAASVGFETAPASSTRFVDSGRTFLESTPSLDFAAAADATTRGCAEDIGAKLSARSKRSTRTNNPRSDVSPSGKSIRPQMSSSIKRGAVAPRICVKPSAAMSAARERPAEPMFCD
ncbi:unannotated protein [freshwater metagenome]|uniref:Unannotated protein n=1 Tax=freshwater metagenome TaxID=449393 RepID=A0A6J6WG37_9ZZZZ